MWFLDIQPLYSSAYSYLKMMTKVINFIKSTQYNLIHINSWHVSDGQTERDQGPWEAQTAKTVAIALTIEQNHRLYSTRAHCFSRKRAVQLNKTQRHVSAHC
jgi:hypothetical protein